MGKSLKDSLTIKEAGGYFVLIALSLLAIVARVYNLNFILGISFTFSGLFLLLILKLYGLNAAVVIALVVQVAGGATSVYPYWNFISVIEILFIGIYIIWRPKDNIVLGDALFWVVIGIPLSAFVYYNFFYHGSFNSYFIQIGTSIANSILNCALADALATYVPFVKLIKKQREQDNSIQFLKVLFHFITIILTVIFVVVFFISGFSSYQNMLENNKRIAKDYSNSIIRELYNWSLIEQRQLLLLGSVQTGKLGEFIEQLSGEEKAHVILTGANKKIIATNDERLKTGEVYDLQNSGQIDKISEGYYLYIPKLSNNTIKADAWAKGSYLHINSINSPKLNIIISFPVSNMQRVVLHNYLLQLSFGVYFMIISLLFALLTNGFLVKALRKLSLATTGVPAKIHASEEIEWPNSRIYEIKQLTMNFKNMSDNFKKMFMESQDLNNTLILQAEQLLESEEKLHNLAYYDMLTDLPNRLMFKTFLLEKISSSKNDEKIIGVMFIDLNQFKQINDTMGHSAGDELLIVFSKRFVAAKRDNLEVFRLGGDEFVFVVSSDTEDEIRAIGEDIANIFQKPVEIMGFSLNISCGIGISMYPGDGEDVDTLIKCADMAMYKSKEKGGCNIQFYHEDIKNDFEEYLILETGIREALANNQFELFYQPKVNAETKRTTSMEALIRWQHPKMGFISPAKFIAVAERSGLIYQIDEWVINEACRQNKSWQDEGTKKIPVAVNISAKHFYEGQLIHVVKKALQNTGLEPQYLQIEITEGVFIKNKKHTIEIMNILNEIGVSVSLDDFGTGYSSFSQLVQLPISELKLDREFIQGICKDEKRAAMVKIIVEFAHYLELNVVAEGVENLEEYNYLKEIKCNELQGYLFSKPVSGKYIKNQLLDSFAYSIE